jgi:hypothetical protein
VTEEQPGENLMRKVLIGTALAFAFVATPAFAQSNSPAGTGGGAGGESGSSSATPSQQGTNVNKKKPSHTKGNTGSMKRNSGASKAGTGGGGGGESGSSSATEKKSNTPRGNPASPTR